MKNTKRETSKERESKLIKQKKVFMFIALALFLLVLYLGYSLFISEKGILEGYIPSPQNSSDITEMEYSDYVTGYIKGILETDNTFFTKLLIFLGSIYLIMVMFSVTGNLISIILILSVGSYRLSKKIYRKIKGIEEEEDLY